jgi:dienelactone hydrolase
MIRRMTRRRVAAAAASALVGSLLAVGGAGAVAPVPVAADGRGTWQVEPLGSGRYAVAWTSPVPLPLTADRPRVVGPRSVQVGGTMVTGRTVRATVAARPSLAAGDLDVVLSGRRLDEPTPPAARRSATAPAPAVPLDLPGTVTLEHDPATPGPHPVVTSDYTLPSIDVPGLPEPVEMVGHVVEPAPDAATGPRPLVLFEHGRHGVCYRPDDANAWTEEWPCPSPFVEVPSHLGYDYLQQLLASQGYATVSVRANGVNAQDDQVPDGGASARAMLVMAHLDHWTTIAADHQVDLRRVVLVGHSRGGEGVARAAIRIPLTAPYRVVGQVLVAPTDFGWQTSPYVPTVTLLPFCDGDITDLQGQRFADTARDLAADDTSLKSSVLVMGANHNYFNTVWSPGAGPAPAADDWTGPKRRECGSHSPTRLSATEQRAVGSAYVAGAVNLFAAGDERALPLFDGSRARVASQGRAQTLSHAIGGGRSVRAPLVSASLAPPAGATTRLCRGADESRQDGACGYGGLRAASTPHWNVPGDRAPTRSFLEMAWTAAGQSGGLTLAAPLDLTGRRLEVRTIVDPRKQVALQVRITDAGGRTALLTPVGGGVLEPLGREQDVRRMWAQALVVDPSAAAVDLTRIIGVDLVAASDRGRVWVADVSAAPGSLAPVPERRLPTLDLDRLTVTEGDRGVPVVRLPFRVNGALTQPAQVVLVTSGEGRSDVQRLTVDLAPGATEGTVPVSHVADVRADRRRKLTDVTAWGTRNVITDSYLGAVTVVDDDPRPRLRVRTQDRQVVEGEPVRWTIAFDRPANYDVPVALSVIRSRRPVRVGDVGPHWIETHVGVVAPRRALWRTAVATFGSLRPHRSVLRMSIPTRRDGVAEGPETLRVRLDIGRRTLYRTVTVVDAR